MGTSDLIMGLVQEIIEKKILVIVEGKKDRKALQALGLTKIILLMPIYQMVESLNDTKEAALLVDLDSEGKKIYRKLKDELSRRGIKVNDKLRNFLFRNTKLRQIEGLANYLDRIED